MKRKKTIYVQPHISIYGVVSEGLLQKVSGQHAPGTVATPIGNSKITLFEEDDFTGSDTFENEDN